MRHSPAHRSQRDAAGTGGRGVGLGHLGTLRPRVLRAAGREARALPALCPPPSPPCQRAAWRTLGRGHAHGERGLYRRGRQRGRLRCESLARARAAFIARSVAYHSNTLPELAHPRRASSCSRCAEPAHNRSGRFGRCRQPPVPSRVGCKAGRLLGSLRLVAPARPPAGAGSPCGSPCRCQDRCWGSTLTGPLLPEARRSHPHQEADRWERGGHRHCHVQGQASGGAKGRQTCRSARVGLQPLGPELHGGNDHAGVG